MVKAALTAIGPRLDYQRIEKKYRNKNIYNLFLTKYKSLVGKENILPTSTENKDK